MPRPTDTEQPSPVSSSVAYDETVAAEPGELVPPTTSLDPAEAPTFDDSASSTTQRRRLSDVEVAAENVRTLTEGSLTREHAGRYHLLDKLGEGGIGVVRNALDRHLGREVAVKELRRKAGTTATREVRFVDEARITGQLEHPGIVPVYELGQRQDGTVYYTMRRIRGRTLAAALEDLSLPDRVRLLPRLIDVCQAMAYAHDKGVVHRDLKPANVMVGEFGETLVVDWGLAKVRKDGASPARAASPTQSQAGSLRHASALETVQGQILGTPAYMPPEQARGDIEAIDARSDVYALGAILYELLTGRPPFMGSSAWDVTLQVIEREVVPPRKREPRAPRELEAVALRALSKDPNERYADAGAMVDDLVAFEEGGLVRAHRYKPRDLLWRWVRRNAVVLAAVATVLFGSVGAWWFRGEEDRRERARVEATRQAGVLAEVEKLLVEARAPKSAGWIDAWGSKLIAMKEPAVVSRLVRAAGEEHGSALRLVVRALGGMGARSAVPKLTELLRPGVLHEQAMVVEVIRALGIIGDPAAAGAMDRARRRYGQWSFVWQNTRIAMRMTPPPPIPEDKRSDANAWVDQGNRYLSIGRNADALAHFDRALSLQPTLLRARTNRGLVLRRLGDFVAAEKEQDIALRQNPHYPFALMNRAVSRSMRGDAHGAVADATHLLETTDKPWPTALRNRALNLMRIGKLTQARKDLDRALELQPRSTQSAFALMRLAWVEGKLDRANAWLDRNLELNPHYASGHRWKAILLRIRGRGEAARAHLDQAVSIDATAHGALAERGSLLLTQARVAAAKADFNRNIELQPHLARTWLERAILLHARRRHWERALADVDQAAKLAQADERLWIAMMRFFILDAFMPTKADTASLVTDGQVPIRDAIVEVARGERDPHGVAKRIFRADDWCQLRLAARSWAKRTGGQVDLRWPRRPTVRRPALPSELGCGLLRAVERLRWPEPSVAPMKDGPGATAPGQPTPGQPLPPPTPATASGQDDPAVNPVTPKPAPARPAR